MTPIDILLIITPIVSFLIARKTSNLLNFFNPFVYFYWSYFLFCFVAIYYRDLYTYAVDITDKTILLISLGFILFPAGGYLANHSHKKTAVRKELAEIINNACDSISTNKYLIGILTALPIFFAVIFTLKVGKILWMSDSFDDERITARVGLGWIAIPGIASAYVAMIYSSIHFYKKKSFIKLFITMVTLSICAISYGNRAPALEIIIIGGIFIWIGLFGKINPLHFLTGLFLSLASVMILGVLRQGLEFSLESIYKQMLWRPFANIQNTEWVLSFIPSKHDFFYGQSLLIDFSVLLPGHNPNFGTYMKEAMGKDFSGGSITLTFLGQAYADFGFVFSLLLIMITGYTAQKIFLKLTKKGRWLPLLIISSITIKSMTSSGIASPIIYGFVPCAIFICFWLTLKSISNYRHIKPINIISFQPAISDRPLLNDKV